MSKTTVLLHGWGGSYAATWQNIHWDERLKAEGYSVVGPNIMGHGVPNGPHDPQDYVAVADDIEAQLGDAVGLNAIGYSLGAKILLELACRRPNRFRRLVIAAMGENAFKPLAASEAIASAMENGLPDNASPGLSKLIAYTAEAGNDPLAMAACMRRPQDRPITPDRLRAVTMPIFVANGDQDFFVLPAEPLTESLQNACSRLYPGVDHFNLLTEKAFIADTLAFLRSPDGRLHG